MGKIVGEVFEEYVQKQITVRQNKLGNTTYDNDLLTYTTSKDSWLRLSSGVDVNEDRLTKLPNIPLSEIPEGNSLASSYVLFGGANNINKSSKHLFMTLRINSSFKFMRCFRLNIILYRFTYNCFWLKECTFNDYYFCIS